MEFVTVQDNVKLEVLDWGGSGRPIVLLEGSGNTAHYREHLKVQKLAERLDKKLALQAKAIREATHAKSKN